MIPWDVHLQTWLPLRRCSAPYLTNAAVSAAPQREHTLSPPGQQKGQATKAKLAQKGKCPRLSFTFISNRIQCQKPERLLLGTPPLAPARTVGTVPTPWPEADDMSTDVLALVRALGCGSDNEEICLSYSSLGRSSCVFNMKHFTVKSNLKTSWIQSSHTFKHDFIWYWTEFSLHKVSLQNYVNTIIIFSFHCGE